MSLHAGLGRFLLLALAAPATDPYTLSLHDALPICFQVGTRLGHVGELFFLAFQYAWLQPAGTEWVETPEKRVPLHRSEEHTSELQSLTNLVCRLLREKKNSGPSRRASRPRAY